MSGLLNKNTQTQLFQFFALTDDKEKFKCVADVLTNDVIKPSISILKTSEEPEKIKEELSLLCELLCCSEVQEDDIVVSSSSRGISPSHTLSHCFSSHHLQLLRNVFWRVENDLYEVLVDTLLNTVIVEWGVCWTEHERERFFDPLFLYVPSLPAFLRLTHHLTHTSDSTSSNLDSVSTSNVQSNVLSSLNLDILTLNEVVRLLTAFVTRQRFVSLFVDYSSQHHFLPSTSRPTELTLLTLITSLPSRIANRLKGKVPEPLRTTAYVQSVTTQILSVVLKETHVCSVDNSESSSTLISSKLSFLAQLLAKFALLGYADTVMKCITPLLLAHVVGEEETDKTSAHSVSSWKTKFQQLFASLPTNSYETLFEALLAQLLHHSHASTICSTVIGPLLKHPQCHFLWTHKFLLVKVYNKWTAVLLMDFLVKSLPKNEFLDILLHIADVWSSTSFIQNASHEQHLYVTQQLVYALRHVQKNELEESGLLVKLIHGVQHHFQSPLHTVRTWGMVLGEVFSKIIDPNNPLQFDYEKTDDFVFEMTSTKPQSLSENERTAVNLPLPSSTTSQSDAPSSSITLQNNTNLNEVSTNTNESETHNLPTQSKTKQTNKKRTRKKKVQEESSEDEGLNPDQPFLPSTTPLSSSTKEQHDTTVHNEDDEEDNRSSSSSTDSLTPYDLDDDLSDVKTVQTPRYLRECIVALSSDEPDVLEVALRTLPTLIRQHPDELEEVSVTLTTTLLHLRDEYSLTNFHSLRLSALIALAVHSTSSVVPFLTSEFYKSNYGLNQRIDILDVLTGAAQELSQLSSPHSSSSSSSSSSPPPSTTSSQSSHHKLSVSSTLSTDKRRNEVIHERLEKNTRLITKRAKIARELNIPIPTTVGPTHTTPNRFAQYVGLFFFPLLRFYDSKSNTFNLLSQESVLLGKLVYSLGVFIECVGGSQTADFLIRLCRALLEFAWCIRYHPSAYVRRALLYALTTPLSVMPSHILLDVELFEDLSEMQHWVQDVFQNDTDEECKKLAMIVLCKWQQLIENNGVRELM